MLVFIAPQMGLNSSYMQKPNFVKKMSQKYCLWIETQMKYFLTFLNKNIRWDKTEQ